MLRFRICGQKLIYENPDEVVVADSYKYLEAYFEFDGDAWNGYDTIYAYFKNGREDPIAMVLSANRIWQEDALTLSAGEWEVYLRAAKTHLAGDGTLVLDKQITSSTVTVRVLKSGSFDNVQNSIEAPDIALQYLEKMGKSVMIYMGEVYSLPEKANENEVYTLVKLVPKWKEYAMEHFIDCMDLTVYPDNISAKRYGYVEDGEFLVLRAIYTASPGGEVKIVQDSFEAIINPTSYEIFGDPSEMPPMVYGTILGNIRFADEFLPSYALDTSLPLDIFIAVYEDEYVGSYIYRNGRYIKL